MPRNISLKGRIHQFSGVNSVSRANSLVAQQAMSHQIPKLIHQTYMDYAQLPESLQNNIEHLQRLNPTWKYRFYSDEDVDTYIATKAPGAWNIVKRIAPGYTVAKIDVFRYLLLYYEGGVYLDIKSSATRPFDEILADTDRFIVSTWPLDLDWGEHAEIPDPHREFQQWFIISARGHPFLKYVIDNVLNNLVRYIPALHGVGKTGVLRLTGPIAFTIPIRRHLARYPHRQVVDHEELGLVYSVFDSHSFKREGLFRTHYSELTSPIVETRGVAKAISYSLDLLRSIERKLAIGRQ